MIFELPLTENKVKPHQVTALHLMAALAFVGSGALFYLFYPPAKPWGIALIVGGLLLLSAVIFRNKMIIKPAVTRVLRVAELAVLLALCLFTYSKGWTPAVVMFGILGAAVVFAFFWEQGGKNIQVITVDTNGVKLPLASRRRHLNWLDIDEVLLKYGVLTINCSDNSMFQWTVGHTNFDKTAFDTFCHGRIEAGKSKRDTNNW
jgi:hypothetical protein